MKACKRKLPALYQNTETHPLLHCKRHCYLTNPRCSRAYRIYLFLSWSSLRKKPAFPKQPSKKRFVFVGKTTASRFLPIKRIFCSSSAACSTWMKVGKQTQRLPPSSPSILSWMKKISAGWSLYSNGQPTSLSIVGRYTRTFLPLSCWNINVYGHKKTLPTKDS